MAEAPAADDAGAPGEPAEQSPEVECAVCGFPAHVILRLVTGQETDPVCLKHGIETLQEMFDAMARKIAEEQGP